MNDLGLIAFTGLATGALAALLYAAVGGVGSWGQLAVVGGIFLATVGMVIALDPLRRG